MEDFTVETFRSRIGDRFRITVEDRNELDSELIEATPDSAAAESSPRRRTPFSLVFRGPLEPILPQRIYCFEHETLGRFEIFIVPIGPDESGMRYEAVFA